ncbi:hypothetical protein DR087_03525 [Mycoplasma hyopneumoniae]|nr:hypothetical protein [Mesomycoplasma hyopneumoniae]
MVVIYCKKFFYWARKGEKFACLIYLNYNLFFIFFVFFVKNLDYKLFYRYINFLDLKNLWKII